MTVKPIKTPKLSHAKILKREDFATWNILQLATWKICPREIFFHFNILPRETFYHVKNFTMFEMLPRGKIYDGNNFPRVNVTTWKFCIKIMCIILASEQLCHKHARKWNNDIRGSDWTSEYESMSIRCICFHHVVIKYNFINQPMIADLTVHESL